MHACRSTLEDPTDYWLSATRAEACLLLRRYDEARAHLAAAVARDSATVAATSTTYRQLGEICFLDGVDPDLLDPIRPPAVIHYTGQMVHGIGATAGMAEEDEDVLRGQIRTALEEGRVGIGFGSLACGADLMVAEALLDRNAELHVVLPFETEAFRGLSVSPAGPSWERRFDRALAAATSVAHVVTEVESDAELLFEAASTQAMGAARLRALAMGSRLFQLALWTGRGSTGAAGTASDIERWRACGLESRIIPVPLRHEVAPRPVERASGTADPVRRKIKAMIFADVRGYSGLGERQLPGFVAEWQRRLAELLERHAEAVASVNTWGDLAYLVVHDVRRAAAIALDLAAFFPSEVKRELEVPDQLGLRVAAHVGPIYAGWDPIFRRESFFGEHVTRTARIEPIAPVASVYVTEPFAARLCLEAEGAYHCEYAGELPLAKNYGRFRVYHLSSRD